MAGKDEYKKVLREARGEPPFSTKPKPGRPRIDMDWNIVNPLMMLEASENFVAEALLRAEGKPITKRRIDTKIALLVRRIKELYGLNFVQYREQKLETRKLTLRQKQWASADAGTPALLIWMGKQYLGQADKKDERIMQEKPTEVRVIWQSAQKPAEGIYDKPPVDEEDLDAPLPATDA